MTDQPLDNGRGINSGPRRHRVAGVFVARELQIFWIDSSIMVAADQASPTNGAASALMGTMPSWINARFPFTTVSGDRRSCDTKLA